MADGNDVVINPTPPAPAPTPAPTPTPTPPAPAPTPTPTPPAPTPTGGVDRQLVGKTLRVIAHLAQGASKLTPRFDMDDRVSDAFAALADQDWFVEAVAELLDDTKDGKITVAELEKFILSMAEKLTVGKKA